MGVEKHDENVAGLNVRVNPEVHSLIDGIPHIIRLYNNIDPIDAHLAALHVHLMEIAFRETHHDHVIGLLDIRRQTLYTGNANDNFQHMLENQAEIWIVMEHQL